MARYIYEFLERDGDIDNQIRLFLDARPGMRLMSGPTLKDSHRGIWEATFAE